MSEMKSEEVRRFFDLLGSIFCGFIFGIACVKMSVNLTSTDKLIVYPISLAIGSYAFSVLPRLYWHLVSTKFLYGYFNFILISVSNVSLIAFLKFLFPNIIPIKEIDGTQDIILLYFLPTLAMAFFWILGIITAWKFSKRETLLK
jgi:hypothetical protein